MKYKVFAVLDLKAKCFFPPFVLPNEDMAERVFFDTCNDPKHQYGAHPEDYHLYELGEWEMDKGRLYPYDIPNLIRQGDTFDLSESPKESPDETPDETEIRSEIG